MNKGIREIINEIEIEEKLQELFTTKESLIKADTSSQTIKGEVIGKIATGFYYVYEDVYISDIIEELTKKEEIFAFGVVNENKKPIGIIVRQHLFDIIGKKFGRDLLENKTVREISNKASIEVVKKTQCFYANTPIFTVVNELENIEDKKIKYFTIINNDGDFFGIFSNIDLLSYLSNLTQKEIKIAKDIQLSIIKEENSLDDEIITIAGATSMAKGLGGDFYTIKKIGSKYVISLCDVSGKGVSSALVSVLLGGFFNIYEFNKGMTNFIKTINNYIFDSFNLQKYLTGVFIKIDEETKKTVIYDMGHSYVYIYRNKKIHKINNPHVNLPIGISREIEVNPASIHLKPNDIFLILSDGVIEQQDIKGISYPLERIENIIEKNENNVNKIPMLILKDLEKFRGKEPQHDDATILVFKYKN